MTLRKLLVANRGEIACRVIRTARRMGIGTVAVFSDADAQAPHVALADEALRIGPAAASESYLSIDALLAACATSGADSIHPGYGFLSENAEFAQACEDAGIVFVGPPSQAIRAMGDKARAKQRMEAAGVPTAPGYLGGDAGDDASDERLIAEAAKVGLPLLVKAVAGGGGRGMRLVRALPDLPAAIASARREARAAFGDDALMLERLIERARHIEIQVFADAHGEVVHLGERDCSTQRRRQKVIEEAPSPAIDPAMRERMGRDAVAAARAVGYRGAGTVEFIVDEHGQHYFLEMNTRLQVEHAVTEAVTGLDLVEWQLRVAEGERLPLAQHEMRFAGHAIEARLYAEDPARGFAPQTGRIALWRPDAARQAGVRVDDGIVEGGMVSPHYDPMLAKFIAHGHDRADAIRRLRAALVASPLLGVATNAGLLHELLGREEFRDATITTATLDDWLEHGDALFAAPEPPRFLWAVAAAVFALGVPMRDGEGRPAALDGAAAGLRSASVNRLDVYMHCDQLCTGASDVPGTPSALQAGVQAGVHLLGPRHAEVALSGGSAVPVTVASFEPGCLEAIVEGRRLRMVATLDGARLHLADGARAFEFFEASDFPSETDAPDPGRAVAPVAGRVTQVLVAAGEVVVAMQPLACVEAMKMEMWLHARQPGTVRCVLARAGDQVEAGALLVELEIEETSP